MKSNKHTFALHTTVALPAVSESTARFVEINDADLWQRVVKVLRLVKEQPIIIFDDAQWIAGSLRVDVNVKNVLGVQVAASGLVQPLQPTITVCPALLKKENFEQVVYMAAQMGATVIQPLLTEQIHRNWYTEGLRERLVKIMVSAAEQSKNFYIPELKAPRNFEDWVMSLAPTAHKEMRLVLDPEGHAASELVSQLQSQLPQHVVMVLGPEGGLVAPEVTRLEEAQFTKVALTPTILRSTEAFAVGLGLLRSILEIPR